MQRELRRHPADQDTGAGYRAFRSKVLDSLWGPLRGRPWHCNSSHGTDKPKRESEARHEENDVDK